MNVKILNSALRSRTQTIKVSQMGIVISQPSGIHLIINSIAVPGGGETLTPKIQGNDGFGNWYDVLNGVLINDTGIKVYKCIPNATPILGFVSNDRIPDDWRIVMQHSGAGAWNYSVSANLFN